MKIQASKFCKHVVARRRQAWCLTLAMFAGLLTGGEFLDGDTKLTLAARAALAEDERLQALDLGISVKKNVARLWGSVPSADLAQRALDRARRVPGVERVIDQLVVESPDDPLVQFLKTPKLSPVFGQALLAQPMQPVVPEYRQAAGNGSDVGPPAVPEYRAPIATTTAPQWRAPANPPGALASRPAPQLPVGNQWWSPAHELTPTMPVMRLPVAGERPGVLASSRPPSALERDLEDLRRAYPSLRTLRMEVQDGVLRFQGPVGDWSSLYELARKAARVPGVQRVLLPAS